MKKNIYEDVPLEPGKRYQTKFQTGDWATLVDVVIHKEKIVGLKVIYESKEYLGVCPLGPDRLIQEKIKIKEVECCPNCGHELENC